MKVDLWIALVIGLVPLLVSVFSYFANKRNADRSSLVDNTAKIQEVYEKTLDDLTKRNEKRIKELENEVALRDAKLEQARQTQGELLVTIEDMKKTVNKVGEDVTFITGDLKKYALAGDKQAYGRRASDKPKEE